MAAESDESQRRPAAEPLEALGLVERVWGLKLKPNRILTLASYDDLNFVFEAAEGEVKPSPLLRLPREREDEEEGLQLRKVCVAPAQSQDCPGLIPHRYVLKIFSRAVSEDVLAFQHEVMRRSYAQGVMCGLPIPTLEGADRAWVRLGDQLWACRLLRYVEGKVLAEVTHTAELLRSIGEQAALIDTAMLGLDIPAAHRRHDWDMNCAFRAIEKYRPAVDPQRLPLLDRHLDYFRERCAAVLERQRDCIIHGDFNDHNLIVDEAGERLVGVIDFGETHHSKLLYEMAIALAYLMLDKQEPFLAAAHVLQGYRARLELTPEELWLLLPCAMLRLVTSFMASSYFSKLEPDNEYLLVTAEPGWKLLSLVGGFGGGAVSYPSIEAAHAAFNAACGIASLQTPGPDPAAASLVPAASED